MTQTTYEEATTCPKCHKPGEVKKIISAPKAAGLPHGTKIHMVYCVTELCRWFNTPWNVTVRADGSIPAPRNHTGEAKVYANIEGHDEMAKRLIDNLRQQHIDETNPEKREVRGNGRR